MANPAKFGQLLVQSRLLAPEEVKAVLRANLAARQEGRTLRLGAALVRAGRITPIQVRELLRAQGKEFVRCEECRSLFNVRGFEAGRSYGCPKCGGELVVVPDDEPQLAHQAEIAPAPAAGAAAVAPPVPQPTAPAADSAPPPAAFSPDVAVSALPSEGVPDEVPVEVPVEPTDVQMPQLTAAPGQPVRVRSPIRVRQSSTEAATPAASSEQSELPGYRRGGSVPERSRPASRPPGRGLGASSRRPSTSPGRRIAGSPHSAPSVGSERGYARATYGSGAPSDSSRAGRVIVIVGGLAVIGLIVFLAAVLGDRPQESAGLPQASGDREANRPRNRPRNTTPNANAPPANAGTTTNNAGSQPTNAGPPASDATSADWGRRARWFVLAAQELVKAERPDTAAALQAVTVGLKLWDARSHRQLNRISSSLTQQVFSTHVRALIPIAVAPLAEKVTRDLEKILTGPLPADAGADAWEHIRAEYVSYLTQLPGWPPVLRRRKADHPMLYVEAYDELLSQRDDLESAGSDIESELVAQRLAALLATLQGATTLEPFRALVPEFRESNARAMKGRWPNRAEIEKLYNTFGNRAFTVVAGVLRPRVTADAGAFDEAYAACVRNGGVFAGTIAADRFLALGLELKLIHGSTPLRLEKALGPGTLEETADGYRISGPLLVKGVHTTHAGAGALDVRVLEHTTSDRRAFGILPHLGQKPTTTEFLQFGQLSVNATSSTRNWHRIAFQARGPYYFFQSPTLTASKDRLLNAVIKAQGTTFQAGAFYFHVWPGNVVELKGLQWTNAPE